MAKKVNIAKSVDMISSLPDEVIGYILSFLPTKIAVSTFILSTRWRNLFPFLHNLDFDGSMANGYNGSTRRFMNFVDRCIMLANGTHIDKFSLKRVRYVDSSCVHSWICAALSRNIRELDLCINEGQLVEEIFTCRTLVVLKLGTNLSLNLPASVYLPCLKILLLESIGLPQKLCPIQRLVSSCPVLEDLLLVRCYMETIPVLSLSSPSLKRLTLSGPSPYKLVLDAPSLLCLKFDIPMGEGNMLKNLHSLSEVHICIASWLEGRIALLELFKGISNVRSLYLSGSLGEYLLTTFNEQLLLTNLTCLVLNGGGYLRLPVVNKLLQCCPNLEKFAFHVGLVGSNCDEYEDGCVDVPVPSRLKEVECKLSYDGVASSIQNKVVLLEYFLKNAEVLEKMQVRIWYYVVSRRKTREEWDATVIRMKKLAKSPNRSKLVKSNSSLQMKKENYDYQTNEAVFLL